jgi:hypothetical protein
MGNGNDYRVVSEFEHLGHQVRIVERTTAILAPFHAEVDGIGLGVNWHLASSAVEDAKREIERQDAEARRKAEPQWQLPPSDSAYAEAEERERFDLCS